MVLILISAVSQATNTIGPTLLKSSDSVWIQVNNKTGLINSLPATNSAELIGQMEEMRSNLQAQKARLTRIAEERKFGIKESLITIIMPGGLLYAAIKQQQRHQAVVRMKDASTHLDEMTRNLAEYRSATFGKTMLAAIGQ